MRTPELYVPEKPSERPALVKYMTRPTCLALGDCEILFSGGQCIAAYNGHDLYFPDHKEITPAHMKLINQRHAALGDSCALVRVAVTEFEYIVAAALIPRLRPLTRIKTTEMHDD